MPDEPTAGQRADGSYIAQASAGGHATVVGTQQVFDLPPPAPVADDAIADARARLAELPLDEVPSPGPLPPGSRAVLARNPLFVGREAVLLAAAAALKGGGTSAQVPTAALTGIGGVGKTQIASEFVHRFGRYFAGGVFWLSFGDPRAVRAEVAACAAAIDARVGVASLPADEQVRLVRAAWLGPLPRLLVLDNCEDEQLLSDWRPTTGGCRVLITSRRAEWDRILDVRAIPVGVLPRRESVQLLAGHAPAALAGSAALDQIASELGDLPLALHLAGSFLNRYRDVVSPADYVSSLRGSAPLRHRSLTAGGRSATGHDQHVARTFEVSFRALATEEPVDALATALLARAIHFAAGEPVPRDLLLATVQPSSHDPDARLLAVNALARLVELGLVEQASDREVRLHRLVVAYLEDEVGDADAQRAVEQALARTYERIRATHEPGGRRILLMTELVGHAQSFARRLPAGPDDARRLFATGSDGERIVALAILQTRPEQACFDAVVEAIGGSRSAFEQYQALAVARDMLPALASEQRTCLVRLLEESEGTARHIGDDGSRLYLKRSILESLAAPGGPAPPRADGDVEMPPRGGADRRQPAPGTLDPPFTCTLEIRGDTAKITLAGLGNRVSEGPAIRSSVEEARAANVRVLVLVMEDLILISSTVREIILLLRAMGPGVDVYMVVSDAVRETLEITAIAPYATYLSRDDPRLVSWTGWS